MKNHRFILQPYTGIKSRLLCPKCQHRSKTFKLYIDTHSDTALANYVGRCDREDSCGYHYTPRDYFRTNPYAIHIPTIKQHRRFKPTPQFNTLPFPFVTDTMKAYEHNNFVAFLVLMFGQEKADELVKLYKIGTASHWPGATIFWQIDTRGRVRTGKIMLYNKSTCSRVKHPFNCITWVHSFIGKPWRWNDRKTTNNQVTYENFARLNQKPFVMQQCLFGEHLLLHKPNARVCLVESEKTAIMGAALCPEYIWLAAGSLNGLNYEKCKVLSNRKVTMFPDVNAHGKWYEKAKELNARMPNAIFKVSDMLEREATEEERFSGIDIADRWINDFLEELHD